MVLSDEDNEERIVEALANSFSQVIKDNPQLMTSIATDLKT